MTSLHYMEEMRKPCPCDGCNKSTICKTQLRACRQFFYYVNSGRTVYGERLPTRELWNKIFVDDTDDEREAEKKAKLQITKEKIREKMRGKNEST